MSLFLLRCVLMLSHLTSIFIYVSLFISLFFEVFLLIIYFEKSGSMKTEEISIKTEGPWPSVSIIIPCFNEEKTVLKTIFSLLKLDYPQHKLKLLVVDDGSTDNTLKVLSRFGNHKQVEIYSKENGGKFTALNFALQKVTSDLVGCLDADSFVAPDALRRIVTRFEDPLVMAVTPGIVVHEPKNIVQFVQKVEYAWGIFLRKMQSYVDAITVTPGPFSIFRTSVFRELGGYRQAHHTEDFELGLRLQKNHYKVVNAHDAKVYTVTPKTIYSLYRQRVRWTYGFFNNMIDYRTMLFTREYGDTSMYILPMGIITVFSALYFTAMFVVSMISKIGIEISKLQTVGFHISLSGITHFDWFFINTTPTRLLILMAGVMSCTIIYISRVMTEGKFRFSMDILYFLAFYGLIVPFWTTKALLSTVFSRNVSWK